MYSPAKATYLGNGSSWTATTTIFAAPEPVPEPGISNNYDPRLVDISGDGLDDYEYTDGTNTYFLQNTGTGWGSAPTRATLLPHHRSTKPAVARTTTAGFDSLTSTATACPILFTHTAVIRQLPGPEEATYSTIMLNTGSGWATSTAYTIATPVCHQPAVIQLPGG